MGLLFFKIIFPRSSIKFKKVSLLAAKSVSLLTLIIAIIFSFLVAGSTSGIAYLLDPAIEKIFIEKDKTLIYLIPVLIILAFFTKGISLYLAKIIMVSVSQELKADVQKDMLKSLISSTHHLK